MKPYQTECVNAFEAITGMHFTRDNYSLFGALLIKNIQRAIAAGLDMSGFQTYAFDAMDDEDVIADYTLLRKRVNLDMNYDSIRSKETIAMHDNTKKWSLFFADICWKRQLI